MPRRKPEGEADNLAPSATPGKDAKKDKGAKRKDTRSLWLTPLDAKSGSHTFFINQTNRGLVVFGLH